jgi:hypothetical protein
MFGLGLIDDGCCEGDGGEEGLGTAVISGRDSTPVLEPVDFHPEVPRVSHRVNSRPCLDAPFDARIFSDF